MQVSTRANRPFDDPAPENPCSVLLDQQTLLEADPLLRQAATVMGIDFAVSGGAWPRSDWGSEPPLLVLSSLQSSTHRPKLCSVLLQELPAKEQNYVRKNYFQVAAVEAVFAVAKIVRCAPAAHPWHSARSAHAQCSLWGSLGPAVLAKAALRAVAFV